MALDLVTGYKGEAHITAEDVGAFNAGVFGFGEYVLNTGNKFSASLTSNNTVKILDGDLMMQGRHITLKKDTFEEVTIENGTSGQNRNDLIVARYTKNSNTGVENVAFAVIKGTETTGTATDPEYTTGDILSGNCTLSEMPLYRIPLSGLTVGTPEAMYNVSNCFNYGEFPISSAEEDTPAKWISIGDGCWSFTETQDNIIGLDSYTWGGTLINKVHYEDEKNVYVTQFLLSGKSAILFRSSDARGKAWIEAKESLTQTTKKSPWKEVSLDHQKPVSGTYTGDGKPEQFIDLGFFPTAVLVSRSDGSMVRSHWGSELGTYFFGGLAVSESDCRFWDGIDDIPVIRIGSGGNSSAGFYVYNSSTGSGSAAATIQTNSVGKFHYVAFR